MLGNEETSDQDWCWLHSSGAETRAAGAAHQAPEVQAKAIYRNPTHCLLAVRQAFVRTVTFMSIKLISALK